jgi:hypothetical protein
MHACLAQYGGFIIAAYLFLFLRAHGIHAEANITVHIPMENIPNSYLPT